MLILKCFPSVIFLRSASPQCYPGNAASPTLTLLSVRGSPCHPAGGVDWDRTGISGWSLGKPAQRLSCV